MNILLLYQFCTFGGVERAILNRARTFKKHGLPVRLSIGYLKEYGALQSFQAYIQENELQDYLSAFLIDPAAFPDGDAYDLVLNIDTPQLFPRTLRANNLFAECHTPTFQNRQYLQTLPKNIRGIIVPSHAFRATLESEFSQLPPIFVLPNPVPDDFFNLPPSQAGTIFAKRPLAYLARVDDALKNFAESAAIFEQFLDDERVMFAVIGRGAEDPTLVSRLENTRLLGKTLLRDQISFDAAPALIRLVRDHRGLFLSSSKGESFGLSAAEFISGGVPVLLSDIAPHRELVNGDERFLYPLGDIRKAKQKIIALLEEWEASSQRMELYRQKFRGESFLTGWRQFVEAASAPS